MDEPKPIDGDDVFGVFEEIEREKNAREVIGTPEFASMLQVMYEPLVEHLRLMRESAAELLDIKLPSVYLEQFLHAEIQRLRELLDFERSVAMTLTSARIMQEATKK